MVTKYTANEYGDFFVASIQQPYNNVVRVLDWNIVAGVKKQNMTGNITGSFGTQNIYGYETQFDTSFAGGDSIIIGNVTYEIDVVINNTELTVTEPLQYNFTNAKYYTIQDTITFFDYEFRWSTDGKVFSEFVPLNHGTEVRDIQGIVFNPLKPLYIDVKSEVAGLAGGNTLTFLSIEFTLETEAGTIESCPNFCTDCTDPFAMNGCANIQVTCNTSNQFNPYALTKSVKMYKQLVNIVNGIFGHQVTYFKTEPDARTTDVILMEYSLHNVTDKQTIKILVPDNEFPTEASTYDIFGIELEDFEIHITAEEFETHFGAGKYPRNKDYMFIPIINRMYEINSVSLADEFNRSHSYWKVKLVKYQDRGDVIKGQFDDDTDVLITGIEEVFGERIQDEYKKNLKPEIFQTVIDKHNDGIRTFVDRKLQIVDYALKNRWTVVSKNHYDFSLMTVGDSAVIYEAQSEVKSGNGIAFSSWFAPRFASNSNLNYRLIGDTADKFSITISNTELIVTTPHGVQYFTHGITFNPAKWYGYVVNINNEFLQLSASIYSLDITNNTMLPQSAGNNLTNEFTQTVSQIEEQIWTSQAKFELRANSMLMTNIRVFDTPIEFEQHSNILNQYVVRDNQHAIIIDNAIPTIGFQKYANAR
jgi:hypothetical protein